MAPKDSKDNSDAAVTKTPPAGLHPSRNQRARKKTNTTARRGEKSTANFELKKSKSVGRRSSLPAKEDPPDEEAFVTDELSEDDDEIPLNLPSWNEVHAEVEAEMQEERSSDRASNKTGLKQSRSDSSQVVRTTKPNSRKSKSKPVHSVQKRGTFSTRKKLKEPACNTSTHTSPKKSQCCGISDFR